MAAHAQSLRLCIAFVRRRPAACGWHRNDVSQLAAEGGDLPAIERAAAVIRPQDDMAASTVSNSKLLIDEFVDSGRRHGRAQWPTRIFRTDC